ncbi:MAG: 3-deoxy-D-manno-octulosonic acid transferase [Pseudomonadota bacterium]
MGELLARTGLRLYRFVGQALYPFSGPFLAARARRGKEDPTRKAERYGYASHARPAGPLIWFHAASVGEALAVLPLIGRLEACHLTIVLTTGTVTSAQIVQQKLSPRTLHQYVPMDMPKAIARFLDHWQPDLAVFAESELWPNTIEALEERRIPQTLVNGRLSDRSHARWLRNSNLARRIFGGLSLVVAQSEIDAQRFTELGARKVSVSGNLKSDVAVPEYDAQTLAQLHGAIGQRPVWQALSTHEGEEDAIATVHRMVAQHVPDLLTVIVPRHPERREDVLATLAKHQLPVSLHSRQEAITPQTAIYLGDTMGEMGLYLRLGPIAFMGKSLKGEGGQNPIEPALTGTTILSGRHVQNFRETYQALLDNRGARLVLDETMLARTVLHLLKNEGERVAMQRAALQTVANLGGALEKTFTALEPHVVPLRMRASLDRLAVSQTGGSALAYHDTPPVAGS